MVKLSWSLLLVLLACLNPGSKTTPSLSQVFPYNLQEPKAHFVLPNTLNEVSGLTNGDKMAYLACLQDEKGQIFFVDKKSGQVTEGGTFKAEGDFEGIEYAQGEYWCIRSKGKLTHFKPSKTPQYVTENLDFGSPVDIEGLGYDVSKKYLLIADKGADKTKESRTIWSYQPDNKRLIPIFEIKKADFYTFLKEKGQTKLADDYAPNRPIFDFGPSSIAKAPSSGHYYILSSVNKLLVVVNQQGQLQDIIKLDKQQHPQPEGLCFDEKSRLYISNEAKNGSPAQIWVYERRN